MTGERFEIGGEVYRKYRGKAAAGAAASLIGLLGALVPYRIEGILETLGVGALVFGPLVFGLFWLQARKVVVNGGAVAVKMPFLPPRRLRHVAGIGVRQRLFDLPPAYWDDGAPMDDTGRMEGVPEEVRYRAEAQIRAEVVDRRHSRLLATIPDGDGRAPGRTIAGLLGVEAVVTRGYPSSG